MMLESGQERILIIAPHADDEVLGCGGLIEKACRLQNKVKVIIGCVGNSKFRHLGQIVKAETRKKELSDALESLGCSDYGIMYDDQDSLLDTIPKYEMVTKIDQYLDEFNPTMFFFPYPSFHQDHQAIFQACMAGLRPDPKHRLKLIAMFEYPFIIWQYPKIHDAGELYLDISETIERKITAFRCHVSQMRADDHTISPNNVMRWAEMRGMEIGVRYAEKYHMLRAAIL